MYPSLFTSSLKWWSFPRTRGDVPATGIRPRIIPQFPPHTRGCTYVDDCTLGDMGVSPAHAGMYPDLCLKGPKCRGFPRTRGDVPVDKTILAVTQQFPPHTRGCTAAEAYGAHADPVSPAHAGMYRRQPERRPQPRCFPRTRGDVPRTTVAWKVTFVFPPHTRGCTPSKMLARIFAGRLFPPHTRGCTLSGRLMKG